MALTPPEMVPTREWDTQEAEQIHLLTLKAPESGAFVVFSS